MASSRVERWIAAAVVHSLCSLVEREHPRAAEWSGRSCQEEEVEEVEADREEEGRAPSRSTAASHDR